MKNKYVCIHGHFYQPPRENPWLNQVEMQDSAYPYHDWNHRITAECYARNSASRVLSHDGRIIQIVNNYARMSFNFGPTLLEWMEKNSPDVYEAILQADKESMKRFSGHGSAIAQVYNHMIMPLANERDKQTQVKWGIRDFEKRFGRFPEGMWLGETAVDTPTLETLADNGILFTILSPYQAKRFKSLKEPDEVVEEPVMKKSQTEAENLIEPGEETQVMVKKKKTAWRDAVGAKIDPRNAYLCRLPSGKSITLFFYDGPISQGIAFERLLDNGEKFAQRLLEQVDEEDEDPKVIHIATDGETYGHHHHFGEMGLSYCLHQIENDPRADLTIYGEYLERYPPEFEVEIIENTSWSCYHGVERWRSNCGCNTGGRPGWNQEWRKPLREAFDWLRDELGPLYENAIQKYTKDPWTARNNYIEVILDRSDSNVDRFFAGNFDRSLSDDEQVTILKLLEMQYHAMLMYTSCGWFFDEVTGMESMQDIMYASRAIQLAREITASDPEEGFLRILRQAKSNIPEIGDAAAAYEKYVKPTVVDLHRVGAHYAISSIFSKYPERIKIYSYLAEAKNYELKERGKYKLAIGIVNLKSALTRDQNTVTFAVLYMGEHHIFGGVRKFDDPESYDRTKQVMEEAFDRSNVHEVIVLMDKHFGAHNYSFWHLFKDDQKKIINQALEGAATTVEGLLLQLYETNYPITQAIKELNIPLPSPLRIPLDFTVNGKLRKALEKEDPDIAELEKIKDEVLRLGVDLDSLTLDYLATQRITSMMESLFEHPEDTAHMRKTVATMKLLKELPLTMDLWKSENLCFIMRRIYHESFSYKSEKGDAKAQEWISTFKDLADHLNLKM